MNEPWRDREKLEAALRGRSLRDAADILGCEKSTVAKWAKKLGVETEDNAPRVSLGDAPSREELLHAEVKDLRSQVAQIRSGQIAQARIEELISSSIQSLAPQYKPALPAKRSKMDTHRFVLQWSDLHAAEKVSLEETSGINEFDWRIMLDRHDRLFNGVMSYKENRPWNVDWLHIWALGDMVTGDIHDELRVTNELVATEAAIQLGLDMAAWVERFVPHFERIVIDSVVGNHGRLTQKPSYKQGWSNWDWVFAQVLKLRLANYRSVSVNVPKAMQFVTQVFDKNVLLFHGDGIQSSMTGVPWGGVFRRTSQYKAQFSSSGQRLDYFACGHYHAINSVATPAGRLFMNGSVKGPDEYSIKRHGGGEPPQQQLLTFHPRHGITDSSIIDL